jgi:hypothetical protein
VVFTLAQTVFGDRDVVRLTPMEITDEVVRLFLGGLNQVSSAPRSVSERSDHATSD